MVQTKGPHFHTTTPALPADGRASLKHRGIRMILMGM
jgi:hypothetical protein